MYLWYTNTTAKQKGRTKTMHRSGSINGIGSLFYFKLICMEKAWTQSFYSYQCSCSQTNSHFRLWILSCAFKIISLHSSSIFLKLGCLILCFSSSFKQRHGHFETHLFLISLTPIKILLWESLISTHGSLTTRDDPK